MPRKPPPSPQALFLGAGNVASAALQKECWGGGGGDPPTQLHKRSTLASKEIGGKLKQKPEHFVFKLQKFILFKVFINVRLQLIWVQQCSRYRLTLLHSYLKNAKKTLLTSCDS
jgi:hypothetical protein